MTQPSLKSLFLFAGEQSGDLHASHLVKALKKSQPDLSITGVAGPKTRSEGVTGPLVMEDFEVMGFTDVIWALPKLYRHFYKVRDHILSAKPQMTVLIDYTTFNLKMAKALREKGYSGKIVQYVSPSVWAWGKERIQVMADSLDLLLTIYPFEAGCFTSSNLNVEYVGNPLSEYIGQYNYDLKWKEKTGLPESSRLTALFPGSRQGEIARNLPIILQAALSLKQKYPEMIFGVSCAHQSAQDQLNAFVKKMPLFLQPAFFAIPKTYTYELMRDSRSAIAKSGTVTLELALHKCPTVVIYKLTALNRFYAQYVLKLRLPHYCIVNILANQTIFPELIENGLSAENLFDQFEAIDKEGKQRKDCLEACAELSASLGICNASVRAAESLLRVGAC